MTVSDARTFGETIVAETERLLELEAAFLVSLAENNCPPDIAEFLVCGDAARGITPRMLQKAIKAIFPIKPTAWMNLEHINAYRSGSKDGIAWASSSQSDFYSVPLYTGFALSKERAAS